MCRSFFLGNHGFPYLHSIHFTGGDDLLCFKGPPRRFCDLALSMRNPAVWGAILGMGASLAGKGCHWPLAKLFTPLRVGGPPTPQAFLANSNMYTKNHSKTFFYIVFTIVFRRKHRNLRGFRHKVGPKQWFLQCFQGCGNSVISPNPWKHRYLNCFLQFFHVPMPLANSSIYTKNPSKTFFSQCFYIFSVKNAVIYTFFGLKSVQNSGFCSVFNALASKNNSKYRYLQCFFISVRFSPAGSRPKWPKIPFQWPLKLRHPKIVEKNAQTPPYRGLGAKSFLSPAQLKLI